MFKASVRTQAPGRNGSVMKHLVTPGSPPGKNAVLNESKTTLSKTPYEFKSTYLPDPQSEKKVSVRRVPGEVMDKIAEDVSPLREKRRRTPEKTWTPQKRGEELLLVLDGARFDSLTDKEEYRAFKQAHLEALRQVNFRQEIMPKNPSAWLNSLAGMLREE